MARTTAEIDGDSSGLVGALDQGRKGMQKMEAEGKKLSDQLKEVADEADKAAGAMVQKIGGPGAIKAIGGIGIAMGVAKAGVDAFLGSAESLFKSFGDEGMKVWDDTEKALFGIKGAFAEAVLGGGTVEQMGARLKSIFEGVKTVLDAALTPIKLLSQAFIDDSVAATQAATATNLYNEAVEKSGKTTANTITLVAELTSKYLALTNQTDALKLAEIGQSLAKIRMQQADVWATEKAMDEARAQMSVAAQRKQIEDAAWEKFKKPHEKRELYPGAGQFYDPRAGETLEGLIGDLTTQALVAAREKEAGEVAVEARMELERLKSLYESFGALYAEVGTKVAEPPKTNGIKVAAEGAAEAVETLAQLVERVSKTSVERVEALRKAEEEAGTKIAGWVASLFPQEDLLTSWKEVGAGIVEVWGQIKDAVTLTNDEITTSSTATTEAHSALYDKYIAQNAKMVATAIVGGKTMAEVGQAAVGTIISALGDEAIAMASIEFFKGNFAGSAGLTMAGMAAYATAAYLGSTAKKSQSQTKATAKESKVVNQNTSYNLQIDAAFADEESIARSFSRAQSIARMRHLTPYAMT